jgi:hypothetical protein
MRPLSCLTLSFELEPSLQVPATRMPPPPFAAAVGTIVTASAAATVHAVPMALTVVLFMMTLSSFG